MTEATILLTALVKTSCGAAARAEICAPISKHAVVIVAITLNLIPPHLLTLAVAERLAKLLHGAN